MFISKLHNTQSKFSGKEGNNTSPQVETLIQDTTPTTNTEKTQSAFKNLRKSIFPIGLVAFGAALGALGGLKPQAETNFDNTPIVSSTENGIASVLEDQSDSLSAKTRQFGVTSKPTKEILKSNPDISAVDSSDPRTGELVRVGVDGKEFIGPIMENSREGVEVLVSEKNKPTRFKILTPDGKAYDSYSFITDKYVSDSQGALTKLGQHVSVVSDGYKDLAEGTENNSFSSIGYETRSLEGYDRRSDKSAVQRAAEALSEKVGLNTLRNDITQKRRANAQDNQK
jgi:hypothetical protein